MDKDPETTGESLLRSVLPSAEGISRLAFVDTSHGMCALLDVIKIQDYAPVISYGVGGVKCSITLSYDWGHDYKEHKIVMDTHSPEEHIKLTHKIDHAILEIGKPVY